ncbi:MAG: TIGR02302 family protein [Rhodobacteraceae bacterium]|nr:TIGR02302 family protein [Paracoccaceae bacterium]
MTAPGDLPQDARARLVVPLALTRLGLLAERMARCFWPLWTILFLAVAALALGLHETAPVEAVWVGSVAAVAGAAVALARGLWRFRWPTRAEAIDRLDRSLPGRPLAALADRQAIGAGDRGSEAVWRAHVRRMAERAAVARPVRPDLRLAERDPFALRYVALTALAVALLFGSLWRVSSVGGIMPGGAGAGVAAGPSWEGWIEPPAYTGKPSLYLNDIAARSIEVPEGSRVTLRLYGEVGALAVAETVSGRTGVPDSATEPAQEFEVAVSGEIEIDGPGGRAWSVTALPDAPPTIRPEGEVERAAGGQMRRGFTATDDYGVIAGRAEIALDLPAVDRRHGLAVDPEPREAIVLDLPMPISGDRTGFTEALVEDLSTHPFANLPVTITLTVEDGAGQSGSAAPEAVVLPGRRFFDPLAAAVIEMRRDLLWNRDNLRRVVQVLRAVTHRPEGFVRDSGAYLQLRVAIRRMEAAMNAGGFTPEARDEMAGVLWDIAVRLEEGDLADALERLRRAQDRLSEAMRNGASREEIAELMQELSEAMQDYMRQLAEQGERQEGQQSAENMQEITGDQLQQMLDEIERLMQEGRMAEAQALLDQLMRMMENLQVTQGPGGQPSPGQQAMEGLGETLREQQELSDDSFRELQEQFGRNGQPQQGQQGQSGQGQEGQQLGQEGSGGQQGLGRGQGEDRRLGQGEGGDLEGSLAERQEALRRELERQRRNLPGAGTEEGEAAREALDRAGRAMERAEQALRERNLGQALDDQAEAMDALREGMRNLGEALAEQRRQEGQQGEAFGQGDPSARRDPLGRNIGNAGRIGTDENLLQGDDVYRRAEELLDEIRRRSGDQSRPRLELDYLQRLLDRF